MALQSAPYRTRHRVTFTYPLNDELEARFAGGAGDGYLHSGQISLNPSNANGSQSDSNNYPINYLEAHTPTAGLSYSGTPTPPGYSGGGGTPSVNGVVVEVATGMYSGDVTNLRVYLEGPSLQQIDLIAAQAPGVLYSAGVPTSPLPGNWQEILLPGVTYLWLPFETLTVPIDETGTWYLWFEVTTTFSDSPNNSFAPYVEAMDYTEVAEGVVSYENVRYVDKEVPDMDLSANVYVATPTMEIKFGPRNGTLTEQPTTVNLPRDSFTNAISKGEPFAPISVLIERVVFDGTGTVLAVQPVFIGNVMTATRNPSGRPNRVLVRCVNMKALLKVPLGMPATAECAWTFTGVGCRVDVFDLGKVVEGTVDSVNGKLALITAIYGGGAPWAGAENVRLYHRGFLVHNGVRMPVREWHSDNPDRFYCSKKVPASWVGETVLLIPGCDKTYETCSSRWQNQARFGGFGRVIPLYNPIVETR